MLYNQPTGGGPNDPYVGKNVAGGIQGSKVPPHAIEFPQREIVNTIVESGQTPTNTDLDQLLRAIRGGQLTTFTDISTSANTITVNTITAHTALIKGLPLRIFPAFSNTSSTVVLNLGGLSGTLKKHDGTPPAPNDVLAGAPIDVAYNGANWCLVGLAPSDVSYVIQSTPHGLQTFTSNGNFTVPAGVTRVYVRVWGAGGSGAGSASAGVGSGGGSAAGYAEGTYNVTPGAVIAVTVASATSGGNSGSAGVTGGTSSFGSLVSATGGWYGNISGGQTTVGAGVGGQVNISGAVGIGQTGSFSGAGGAAFCSGASSVTTQAGLGGCFPGGGGSGAYGVYGGGGGAAGLVIVEW